MRYAIKQGVFGNLVVYVKDTELLGKHQVSKWRKASKDELDCFLNKLYMTRNLDIVPFIK